MNFSLMKVVTMLLLTTPIVAYMGIFVFFDFPPLLSKSRNLEVDLTKLPELPIYTYGHYVHPYMCLLAKSVFHSSPKHPLRVLGMRSSCKNKLACHMDKVTSMVRHLERDLQNASDDQLFIFVDGFDVLFQRDIRVVIQDYHHFEEHCAENPDPIVFNGEQNCFPFTKMNANKYNKKVHEIELADGEFVKARDMCGRLREHFDDEFENAPYPHLNSGVYIGKKAKILDMLRKVREIKNSTHPDIFMGDQGMVQIASLKYPELNIVVDSNQSMFATINQHQRNYLVWEKGCSSKHFSKKSPYEPQAHPITKTTPAILHFNSKPAKNVIAQCSHNFEEHWKIGKNSHKYGQEYFIDVDAGKKGVGKKVFVNEVCPPFGQTVTWFVIKFVPVAAYIGLWTVVRRKRTRTNDELNH